MHMQHITPQHLTRLSYLTLELLNEKILTAQ